ncbi:MAG: spore coat protein CotJB [Ruminococcaceae bacterium]|nr:spore coat protein CotJB [Oscillospiraceae bacterium]
MVCKSAVEKRIAAYKFALYDLGLYLDSHPCDAQAMQLRCVYKERLAALIDEYEQHYGKYVVTMADVEDSWAEWVKDPWPWDVVVKGDGRCVAV